MNLETNPVFHNVVQNTDAWFSLRAGKVTGSTIGYIMANYGNSFGEPAKRLAVNIAVERITGEPIPSEYTNTHMERGSIEEPIARLKYEKNTFQTVTNGGFFDNGKTGCSPDGICGNGIIEIKSALPHIHYRRLMRNNFDHTHKWQVVFNLIESGAEWIDYISYCSKFPKNKELFITRLCVKDCESYALKMRHRLSEFEKLICEISSNITS